MTDLMSVMRLNELCYLELRKIRSTPEFHLHMIKLLEQLMSLEEVGFIFSTQPNEHEYSHFHAMYRASFSKVTQFHEYTEFGRRGNLQIRSLERFESERGVELFLQLSRRNDALAWFSSELFYDLSKISLQRDQLLVYLVIPHLKLS